MGQETPKASSSSSSSANLKTITLDFANLKATRVLGRGALGTVFLVTTSDDPHRPFALKVVSTARSSSRDFTRRIERETTILSLLSHPFLPSLVTSHVLFTPFLTAYAIPFFPGGDLNNLQHAQPDHVFSTASLRFYAAEIVSALFHLHSQLRIIYRDLKPENVLIQQSGHITLSDFDLSHRIESDEGTVMPNSFVGTEEYIAPEVLKGETHGFGVDFWSFGVLMYEMAYGSTPFKGKDRRETFRNVVEKDVEFGMGREDALKDLVRKLLVKDPENRLGRKDGAEEVMSHEFFKGVKWEIIADVDRPPFIPPVDEEEVNSSRGGFDIRDYFEKERRRRRRRRRHERLPEEEEESSASTSFSSPEF